jgi:hypothetical protein
VIFDYVRVRVPGALYLTSQHSLWEKSDMDVAIIHSLLLWVTVRSCHAAMPGFGPRQIFNVQTST